MKKYISLFLLLVGCSGNMTDQTDPSPCPVQQDAGTVIVPEYYLYFQLISGICTPDNQLVVMQEYTDVQVNGKTYKGHLLQDAIQTQHLPEIKGNFDFTDGQDCIGHLSFMGDH